MSSTPANSHGDTTPPGTDGGALPTFLIIGAAKCGTTSLHRYLAQHPEICMSARKELKVFSRDDYQDYLGWYAAQFSAAFAVRGESSPAYSAHPWIEGVPERIHSTIPTAKLIYLVRDPVERFISHYIEERAHRMEDRSFDEVVAGLADPDNRGVLLSRYAFQLEQFRGLFPSEQILVVDQWDLLNDRPSALREIFEFLEVEASFWSPEFDRRHNQRESKFALNGLGSWLHRRELLTPIRSRSQLLPNAVRERTKALVSQRIEPPAVEPALRQELERRFAADAEQLRRDTGKPFSRWSV
jgi:hypothetical protein